MRRACHQPILAQVSRPALPPRVDPFADPFRHDPHSRYAELRDSTPLCRAGPGRWLVLRHADVSLLLRHRDLRQFRFDEPPAPPTTPVSTGEPAGETDLLEGNRLINHVVAAQDRPGHPPLRRLLSAAVATELPAVTMRLRTHVDALIDAALDTGTADAVTAFAEPLPRLVLTDLLGLPEGCAVEACHRVVQLSTLFSPPVADQDLRETAQSVTWLRDLFTDLLSGDTHAPNGLLRQLASAAETDQWSRAEIVDNLIFLLLAGFETSAAVIASGCALLSHDPQTYDALADKPDLAEPAVEEFLRLEPPTQITGRRTTQTIRIADHAIGADRLLLLAIIAANRDPAVFDQPDRLVLDRTPNPHLSFGGGVHYCLGAGLARLEARAFFERLVRRSPTLHSIAPAHRQPGTTVRPFLSVPVGLGPRRV